MNLKILLPISLALALVGCSSPEQKMIDKASDLANKSDYTAAINAVNQVPSTAKEYPDAQKKKAEFYRKLIPLETRQAATSALQALQDFNARLDVGLSYHEYLEKLGDVNVAFKRFESSPDSPAHPISPNVLMALYYYSNAQSVWNCYIEDSERTKDILPESCASVVTAIEPTVSQSEGMVFLTDGLNVFWKKASAELKKADRLNRTLSEPSQ